MRNDFNSFDCVSEMSSTDGSAVHLVAGAVGGTTGAVLTCPLEVIKTRLQSSSLPYRQPIYSAASPVAPHVVNGSNIVSYASCSRTLQSAVVRSRQRQTGLIHCIKNIVQTEGVRALFKGLGPNLIGVAPSRAVYFYAYAKSKQVLNTFVSSETPVVHIISAACAGFSSATCTNPIWFIKTRLQLDQKLGSNLTAWQCARGIYRAHGLRGFYKGLTASYYGLSETIIHLVIYEEIKIRLREMRENETDDTDDDVRTAWNFVEYMGAAATSKTCATCVAYPHEVARTRLREEGSRYHTFWQTITLVFREEGMRGLYRGLVIQLVRQIPNTAIMMSTYELVVYVYQRHINR